MDDAIITLSYTVLLPGELTEEPCSVHLLFVDVGRRRAHRPLPPGQAGKSVGVPPGEPQHFETPRRSRRRFGILLLLHLFVATGSYASFHTMSIPHHLQCSVLLRHYTSCA